MKLIKHLLKAFLLIIAFQTAGCRQDDNNKNNQGPLVEKVFVVNIVPNEQKLKEYLTYHSKVWPEVEAGFRKAGYKKIALHRFNHLVVMIITVSPQADLAKMGKLAESYSPKCAAWNKLMQGYQTGVPGTTPGQTWVEAAPFYQFENH
jgi:L-rhamnose mutarotase